jgi:hypothetical protein
MMHGQQNIQFSVGIAIASLLPDRAVYAGT